MPTAPDAYAYTWGRNTQAEHSHQSLLFPSLLGHVSRNNFRCHYAMDATFV